MGDIIQRLATGAGATTPTTIRVVLSSDSALVTQYVEGVTQSTPTGISILGKTSGNVLKALSVDSSGVLNVNATVMFPSGAATEAKQDDQITALTSIDGKLPTIGQQTKDSSLSVVFASDSDPIAITGSITATNPSVSANDAAIPASSTLIGASDGANLKALLVDGSGNLKVAIGAVALPTGASTSALQTTGNSSLSSIDAKITAVNTGAVVVASSALPAGAATAAKQPALGTAGTASTDVITIQGIASMTAIKVDGSAVTQPISVASLPLPAGAATSAKQPALGTAGSASADVITIQGIASMTALKVDGSAVTQPVSAASLPLPSGASTSAKQPALGTAGSASADVITIQGIASMTALKVDGSAVTQPVSVSSLPLPAGAATSALQTSGNASLTSIDSKITAVNTGAVVVSSSALPTGASTSALQTTGNSSLSSIDGKITAVNTGAVVVASSALPTGASTSALQTTGNSSLSSIDGKITAVNTGAVVVASSALPTGASTSAKQPALGTAGSASADVITVQGVASMTALKVDGSAVTQPVSYATTGSGNATGALRVELANNGTGVIATVGAVTAITNALPTGTNSIGTVQIGNTANTTPILANSSDPAASTGNITTVDSGTSSTTNAIAQTIITGSPTANSAVVITLAGHTAIAIQLSGTASQTLGFERSADGGTTYIPFSLEEVGIGLAASSITISDNKAYLFRGGCAGMTHIRVRATAVTSGTVAVKAQPTFGVTQIPVNQGIGGATTNRWPVQTLMDEVAAGNLTSSGSSADTTLTVGTKAISIYARNADAYYKVGTGSQTASSSTHYIGAGERKEINLSNYAAPHLAIINGPMAVAANILYDELT